MDSIVKLDLADELRIEGINFKGYGIIPKFVMLDTDLTVEAKGIYAYFCSYAGSGNTAFPGWEKIVSDLRINKDSYYKHYKLLLENGYIQVKQESKGGRGQGFSRNIYTLVSNPKKFYQAPEENTNNKAYAIIKAGGIKAAGYGFIAKSVMTDTRLSIKAKALYAYYCSFSGAGDSACPKKDIILHHLQISSNSFIKYNKELTSLNYINVVQRHLEGRLSVNDYIIVDKPDKRAATSHQIKAEKIQHTKISETQIPENNLVQDTNFSETQIQETSKQETKISEAIINKSKINKKNNNQSDNQQQPVAASTEGQTEEDFLKILKGEGTLPKAFLEDKTKLTEALKYLSEFERFGKEENYSIFDNGSYMYSEFMLYFEALSDLLKSKNGTTISGELITKYEVYDKLTRYIQECNGNYYITDLRENACSDYRQAVSERFIKNHLAYMKACIWNALKVGNMAEEADISYERAHKKL